MQLSKLHHTEWTWSINGRGTIERVLEEGALHRLIAVLGAIYS